MIQSKTPTMSKTFDLVCNLCEKKFKTYRSFKKHHGIHHVNDTLDASSMKFVDKDNSSQVDVPLLRQLDVASPLYKHGYLLWLTGVAEQVNSSLHPNFPGGWFKIDFLQLPSQYFQHFVLRLQCEIDSIRVATHKRPPTYRSHTKRISYKQYDIEKFVNCMEDQTLVSIKREILFSGTKETTRAPMTIEEEIEAAASRDPWNHTTQNENSVRTERATFHANLQVGFGQGRSTREVEVIWWPDLYEATNNGHFTLRFYLQKVSL